MSPEEKLEVDLVQANYWKWINVQEEANKRVVEAEAEVAETKAKAEAEVAEANARVAEAEAKAEAKARKEMIAKLLVSLNAVDVAAALGVSVEYVLSIQNRSQ